MRYPVGVSAPVQGSLFDHCERRDLGSGAWIEWRSAWVDAGGERADSLLPELAAAVPWRAERRRMYDRVVAVPRLVSFCDLGDPTAVAPHPSISRLRRRLNDIYAGELGEQFTTAGFCLYRDGSDSVAWHGDTRGRGAVADTMVAVVSLGATRVFALRPRGGGPSLRLPQRHGDLLVMGGSCQRTWEHAVPKDPRAAGPRISIQFRPRGVR